MKVKSGLEADDSRARFLRVLDVLLKAAGAQDVVGHALAPLAAGAGIVEESSQALGGGGKLLGRLGGVFQALLKGAVLLPALSLEFAHELLVILELIGEA